MAEEDGVEPKALQDRPEVFEHLQFVWSAWWSLHADRPIGWGAVGDIPFTAMDRYADRYGIVDIDAFERFTALIDAMDGAYRDWTQKRVPE